MIAFRVDFNDAIGGGHLNRCKILCRELARRGHKTVLLTQQTSTSHSLEDFSQILEGDETYLLKNCPKVRAIIFDHYKLDASTHKKYRDLAGKIICFDDLTHKKYYCDMIFDANLNRKPKEYSPFLVKTSTKILTGQQYQLIDELFSKQEEVVAYNERNQNLIYFSLGLSRNCTLMKSILDYFFVKEPQTIFGIPNTLKQFTHKISDNVVYLDTKKSMVEFCCRAHAGIGAAGTMTWERNAVGLPTYHVIIADNQRAVAEDMQQLFFSPYWDYVANPRLESLMHDLERFINDTTLRRKINTKLQLCITNNAAQEIAEEIFND